MSRETYASRHPHYSSLSTLCPPVALLEAQENLLAGTPPESNRRGPEASAYNHERLILVLQDLGASVSVRGANLVWCCDHELHILQAL